MNVQGVRKKTDPCCFAKFSITIGTFFSQILHTHVFNKVIHVDYFWCLISKIQGMITFLSTRVSNFAIKIFNLMYQVKFYMCYNDEMDEAA